MIKRIDHIEIVPVDLEKTISFYTDIIGFKIKERIPMNMGPLQEIVYITLADTTIELLSYKNPISIAEQPAQVGYRTLALEVDDMDKTIEYLKSKGVAITWGPMTLGKSKRAEIKDPSGLSIELRQW